MRRKPVNWVAAGIIIGLWIAPAAGGVMGAVRLLAR
jgi:hypothetical protein